MSAYVINQKVKSAANRIANGTGPTSPTVTPSANPLSVMYRHYAFGTELSWAPPMHHGILGIELTEQSRSQAGRRGILHERSHWAFHDRNSGPEQMRRTDQSSVYPQLRFSKWTRRTFMRSAASSRDKQGGASAVKQCWMMAFAAGIKRETKVIRNSWSSLPR